MRASQLKSAAGILRSTHGGNAIDIIAEDMSREAEDCSGWETAETFAAERVIPNTRGMLRRRVQIVIRAAALADDPSTCAVDAADALRDWLRDEVVEAVCGNARARVASDMRRARFKDSPDWDSPYATPDERELAEGYELFVHSMAHHAATQIDWLGMARSVIGTPDNDDAYYADHITVLRALYAAYPNLDEPAGECNAYTVARQMYVNPNTNGVETTKTILHELCKLGLVTDRYVGGESGHIFAPVVA